MQTHYALLEKMYLQAPVQKLYPGLEISIREGSSTIQLSVQETFFHSGNAVHGSVYFKLLDDAAYFAAASFINTHFIVSADFTIRFLKPVHNGILTATGRCEQTAGRLIPSSAELRNAQGELIATGEGHFMKSRMLLGTETGYDR